jgi:hypothetical protein
MPNYNSIGGKWEPAKERVVLPNAEPGKEVYEGPDRAALEQMREQGVESFGQDFMLDPDLQIRARSLGFKTVKEYLNVYGYDEKKSQEQFAKTRARVVDHKRPQPKPAVRIEGGGTNTAPGSDIASFYGGLGSHMEAAKKQGVL